MQKKNIQFLDEEDNKLFNEKALYTDIPPVGRYIKWSNTQFIVSKILENWDQNIITITLRTLKE